MWTCSECENSYDANTGDVDERICNDCMEREDNDDDKWMPGEAFWKRVDEVEAVLNKRWEHVHPCDVNHGFFYCCGEKDTKGYRPESTVRVCDGCGDDLYFGNAVKYGFHCTECELKYTRTGEIV